MDTGNPNKRIPGGEYGAVWRSNLLARRARYYFDQPPVESQDQVGLEAAARKLYSRNNGKRRTAQG